MKQLFESGEMYLETIYVLSQSGNVRSIDIAEHMSFTKPSVSRAVNMLKQNGYIEIAPNGFITLTAGGLQLAQKIYERHTVLTEALIALGVPRPIAVEDACKMEHVISDATFAAIKAAVEKAK